MITKAKWYLAIAAFSSLPVQADNMNLDQLLQNVINHYPAIKTAYIQVAKAQQDNLKIQGQLGWQLGTRAGISQEVSLFGVPVDQITLGGSLGRKLESGDSLNFSASVSHDDAETATFSLPNPATSTNLTFEYIKPLGKGAGNIEYLLSLASAEASIDIQKAAKQTMLDQLAEQIIDLYLGAINTRQQIDNTLASIQRTEKLSKFINQRLKLGIVETKDQLQTDAQLQSQKAQLTALQLVWTQQQIAINRLTGQVWDSELTLQIPDYKLQPAISLTEQSKQAELHNPALLQINSLISIAENQIKVQRNGTQDNLDLKFYVGNKTSEGDTTSGNVSNSDVVAGVSLEFKQSVDKTADNAALYQAQLERGLQLQNKKQTLENLHYDMASLLAEANAVKHSINAYALSKKAELKKLQDAEERYHSGRIDVDQLLQFENQLSATELSLNLQKTELQKRLLKLALKTGKIWQNITLPVFDFETDEMVIGEGL